ncbi:glycosyl transferase [Micromonospora rosaria]|uniref:Glycosyl transferase n=1 Tax=Micromonospora rosaria TaxID=47874 RepID=A0A136PUE4_9ACTN|nr:glycosyltransferase family A protein [Micromonospora rosaria]KXK62089.1 glycosyl transferase [Micromonospora rosaria]
MTIATNEPKVSVVVPAYNPGPHIEKLISSLLRQSLPAEEFEVVIVDDGSTDETPARLDALAADQPNVRVLHIENSGWPSRPRNLGIEEARGEYVFFADDDDWFGDEALERMYACAKEHDADIVVGKMIGHGRGVPRELFRKNRFGVTLADAPLVDSMTCHKLFRRSMLLAHDLRFPEGKRRLEDHVMVIRAFFVARRTCVLSDYPCYHHIRRADAGNVTATRLDPAGYYTNLREALDVVDEYTKPGPLRDRLHRRWLRNEMISRLSGKALLQAPEDWAEQVAYEVRDIIRERFAPGVAAGLPPRQRAVAFLAEQGRLGDLRTLAEWETGVRATATLDRRDQDGTVLHVAVSGYLRSGDDLVTFVDDGGRDVLSLPVPEIDPDRVEATAEVSRAKMDLIAWRKETNEEIFLPVQSRTERVPHPDGPPGAFRLIHHSTADIDFSTLNGGRTEGTWVLKARINNCGWTLDAKLPKPARVPADGAPPALPAQAPPAQPLPLHVRLQRRLRRLISR